jgi:DNA-binding MarR family transcriptional regulator
MQLELIFNIHRATHRIGLYVQRHAPGLSQADAHILCHLHEAGDSTIADLHGAFAHKRSTLTSVLDRLESNRLIVRKTSTKDRRSFVVSLTPAGKKKAAKVHRVLEALESGVLRKNDAKSLETFGRVIRALEDRAATE